MFQNYNNFMTAVNNTNYTYKYIITFILFLT